MAKRSQIGESVTKKQADEIVAGFGETMNELCGKMLVDEPSHEFLSATEALVREARAKTSSEPQPTGAGSMRPTRLTVSAGEQVYAPVSYNSFRVGAITLEFEVQPGASIRATAAELLAQLAGIQEQEFHRALQAHLSNVKVAAEQARGR